MFDSHICDYNYKCLTFISLEEGYIPCPHDKDCNINERVCKSARGHYNRHVTAKKNKPSYATIPNPSVPAIKAMYRKFLIGGFTCAYCGRDMTLDRNCLNSSTIDHVKARGLGGNAQPRNMTLCCWECNRKKGHVESYHLKSMKGRV